MKQKFNPIYQIILFIKLQRKFCLKPKTKIKIFQNKQYIINNMERERPINSKGKYNLNFID